MFVRGRAGCACPTSHKPFGIAIFVLLKPESLFETDSGRQMFCDFANKPSAFKATLQQIVLPILNVMEVAKVSRRKSILV